MTNGTNERQMIVEWFENDFKQSIMETTSTRRLDNGKVSYAFSVVNTSGFDFDRFSFKVRILNKADGSELGSSVIEAGQWPAGDRKSFQSELTLPDNVTGISFVAFSESISYDGRPAQKGTTDSFDKLGKGLADVGRELGEAGKNLGELIENGDASGVFGELFGTGGMPGTVTKETTKTVSRGGTTTTTRTTTTTHKSAQRNNSGSVDARPSHSHSGKTSNEVNRGATKRSTYNSKTTTYSRSNGGTYADRKLKKKLDKKRLGKSTGFVVAVVFGVLMLLAAMGSTSPYEKEQQIEYAVAGVCLLLVGAVLKILSNNKGKRIRFYESMVNKKGNTVLFDMATKINRPVAKVADDLQEMIVMGFFPGAFVDVEDGLLVMTDENGEPLVPISDTVARNKRDKRKMARANGKVPNSIEELIIMTDDDDIKKKLRELDAITDKLNKRVKERPDLEEQVKEFTEKFYPEVVRLTDEYNEKIANLDATDTIRDKSETEIYVTQTSLSEQAQDIKKHIIKLLDNVIESSANLLEKLHEDDIMDIETDIQALKNKVAGEGLMDSDFDIH